MDKTKIIKKLSKTGKHGHENGRAQKKPGNQAKVKKSKLSKSRDRRCQLNLKKAPWRKAGWREREEKKGAKNSFTVHCLPQFTKGSKREGFYQSKGGKDNSSSQVHNGREKDVILIGKVKQKITRGLERAQGMGEFVLYLLSKEAQSRLTHGCHVGNPCVPNMIQFSSNDWKNGWQRLMGAWVDLKRLEGLLRGYK
ncbi:hypothetical protein Tco_1233811, partial [Tanacetum coccineum]